MGAKRAKKDVESPTKLGETQRAELLAFIGLGAPVDDACYAAGVPVATFRAWLREPERPAVTKAEHEIEDFRTAVRRADSRGVIRSLKLVHDAESSVAVGAHQWLLAKRRRAAFGSTAEAITTAPNPSGVALDPEIATQAIAVLESVGVVVPDDLRRQFASGDS
jgi:hypothetical protein